MDVNELKRLQNEALFKFQTVRRFFIKVEAAVPEDSHLLKLPVKELTQRLKKIPTPGAQLAAMRRTFGGPAKVFRACVYCGAEFSARALRTHQGHAAGDEEARQYFLCAQIRVRATGSGIPRHEAHRDAYSDRRTLLYDRKATAKLLSISVRSVDYMIQAGRLGHGRIGSRVLIPATQVRRVAETGCPYGVIEAGR